MTIDNKIKQLNRQDFVEYLYQLQMFAKEKYSFDVFLENRVLQGSEFTDKINKREIDFTDCLDLGGQLDEIDVREFAHK